MKQLPLTLLLVLFLGSAAAYGQSVARLPESRLKIQIANALESYRDGSFWWQKIDQPRVVHVSALRAETTSTSSDAAFSSTVPYTVAIHWRQAHRYLSQAEKTLGN